MVSQNQSANALSDSNGMHSKLGLRVFLKWSIAGSGSRSGLKKLLAHQKVRDSIGFRRN